MVGGLKNLPVAIELIGKYFTPSCSKVALSTTTKMDAEKKELENSVPAEAVEPQVIQAVDVYPVGVEAANPNIEGDAIRDDFI